MVYDLASSQGISMYEVLDDSIQHNIQLQIGLLIQTIEVFLFLLTALNLVCISPIGLVVVNIANLDL